MSSTQRVVLTVAICTGLLIAWQYLFAPPPRPPDKKTPGANQSTSDTSTSDTSTSEKRADNAEKKTPDKKGRKLDAADASAGPLTNDIEGKLTKVALPDADVAFSTTGATLRHWVLKHPRYKEIRGGKLQPVDLVRTKKGQGPWQIVTDFPGSDFQVPEQAAFRLVKHDGRQVRYEWASSKVRVSKHYVIDKHRPMLWLTLQVRNLTDRALAHRLRVSLFSHKGDNAKAGFANPYPRMATGLCFVNGELQRRSVGAITGEQSGCSAAGCGMGQGPVSAVGQVGWIGSDDRYFLTAVVPKGDPGERRCELKLRGDDRSIVETSLLFAEQKIAAEGEMQRRFAVYVGAKELGHLDGVTAAKNQNARLIESVEFGWFAVLCVPMLKLLQFFHQLFGNWGIAIILLTIVVKLLTLWPTQKSMRSMKNLQKVKPKLDELREKYKDDKARLNQEMMQLYKVHKINPLGGCLPMLIQMPIWFALYRTLGNAVELYRSPFFGWITDLTAPDRLYILPILMGLAMFGQQAITPQAMTGTQAKMMKYFMPGMFTMMMLWLPSGLTLYIFVNTGLSLLHQLHMNRTDPDRAPSKKQEAKTATVGAGPPPSQTRRRAETASDAPQSRERQSGQRTKKKKRRRKSRKQ